MSGVSMGGLLDSAKKVFESPFTIAKGVTDASIDATKHSVFEVEHNPIVKTIAIAAAIYFTAGIAMAAFPETAGFAAAMPGVDSAAGAMGVTAATADTAAAASGVGALGTAGTVGADAGAAVGAGATADAGAGAGAGFIDASAPEAMAGGGAAAAPAAAGTGGAGMTGLEKIAAAKVASDAIAGAVAPSPQQEAAAQKKFQGAFFGQGQSEGGTNTNIVPPGGFNILPGSAPKPGGNQAPNPNNFAAAATGGMNPGVAQPPQPTAGYNILPGA